MAKSREHITHSGKAAFYACIWPDLMNAAMDVGWALGIHGSLQSDMDVMAMPWVEGCASLDGLVWALRNAFTEPNEIGIRINMDEKPNNRIVVTMSIWADFYIDLNIINNDKLVL